MGPEQFGIAPETLHYLVRLLVATLLGGVIGFEREAKDRPAGLRTHMLTALAAALFTVLTVELHADFNRQDPDTSADPLRIVEAVTAGVAFLAAGAIIQSRGKVHGLTTGAGMWLSGAVGVACGSGHYVLAVIPTVLATIVLALLRPLEKKLTGSSAEARPEPNLPAKPPVPED